jgi:hypothetical protein
VPVLLWNGAALLFWGPYPFNAAADVDGTNDLPLPTRGTAS